MDILASEIIDLSRYELNFYSFILSKTVGILTRTSGSSLNSALSSLSSDKEYLASPVTWSTGPFSIWTFIALYNIYNEDPA